MGVFPFLTAATLETTFAPIAVELGDALGRDVRLTSSASFEAFTQRLARGDYDIAHVQPFDYVTTAAPAGYVPVAARHGALVATISVRSTSSFRKLQDLAGRVVGIPPPTAAVAHLTRLLLLEAGLRPPTGVTFKHLPSHEACLQELQLGRIDACGSGPSILRLFVRQNRAMLRVVARSRAIPETTFVVHRRVPEAERKRIAQHLIATHLAGVPHEVRGAFFAQRDGSFFRTVDDAEFDVVRRYARQLGLAR